MSVIFEAGYTLPNTDEPLTHARIAHSRNWLAGGVAVASSTATDYFADAPLNSLTYELWKPSSVPATWEYDHTASVEADAICVAAHTLGTTGCTFKFQYWDGASWVDLTAAGTVADDSPIMAIFEPVTAERWRINITAGTAPEIGVLKVAKVLQMQRSLYGGHTPIDFGRQTILRSNMSETGEYLGRTKQRNMLATSYSWENLTADWVRSNWGELQRAVEAEPFFIAWRPGTYGEVGYCQTDDVPAPQNMGTKNLMAVSLTVRGLAYD